MMDSLKSTNKSTKILIVEDEKIISWHLEEVLQSQGYQVLPPVTSGKTAIESINSVKPDLVLMDIRLEGEMDGIETANFLYSKFNIPIIYLTAHSDRQTLAKATQTNPFGYLLKPFDPKELHCTIQIALQRHHSESQMVLNNADLYECKQEFATLAENAPNAIARFDLQMRYLYANPFLEKITGRAATKFIGKTPRQLDCSEYMLVPLEASFRELLATGKEQQYEVEYQSPYNPDETAYFQVKLNLEYNTDGKMATILLVATDITTTKLNEIALQEANRRWQSLLDNVRLVVVSLDSKGKVEYANPFFLTDTGYTLDEVLGKDWFSNFLPQREQEKVTLAFADALKNDFYHYYQNSIVTKTGEEKVIAWNNTRLYNKEGEMIGTLSIGEDITEKLQVDRVKDEFVSIVSHEMRTPLASIRGALGLLTSGVLENRPDVAQHMLNIAAFDIERLVRLVNDILDLERLGSNKISLDRQWWDVLELCQEAIESVQALAVEKHIQIKYIAESIQILVDRDRLVQTLVNLLSNAIKFSPTQSHICIQVESLTEAIVFQISDRGRGIPPDQLESIFERFHQVDASDSRQMGGTGLGLAICRSIVEQHGGKIWAESVLTEGSTFFFTIPHLIN